jgi:peptidoglycan/xylan/chitin deacetylase (PgdA/CDA1 family)
MKHRKLWFAIAGVLFLLIGLTWLGSPGNGIPVLTYHHIGAEAGWLYVSENDFEQQLVYLRDQGYSPISVAELAAGLAGRAQLPKRPIVLTFDDGYDDNYRVALPVLLRQGMRASFFVVTGKIGQPGYMTWAQARQMREQGMEIGSHTVHHYTLNEINLKEMERELLASRLMLESNLPPAPAIFANPFGETAPAVVKLLAQTGYQAACSSVVGLNHPGENLFMIRRLSVPKPRFGIWDFRLRLWWLNMSDRLEL